MDLKQIMQRSVCGYIFVIPGLLVYFALLRIMGKKQTRAHTLSAFVFCYYLIGALTMTGIGKLKGFSPRLVLIPFWDMIAEPTDTILNVILFIPFGFFLSHMYRNYSDIRKAAFTGMLLSLTIELVQLFGRGVTDINDLISNTAGTCFGYYFYKMLSKMAREGVCDEFKVTSINECFELPFFIIYSFVIMVTIQPIVVQALFQLG